MNLTVSTAFSDSLAALKRARTYGTNTQQTSQQNPAQQLQTVATQATTNNQGTTGTRLVAENRQSLADGAYRLTRTYEQESGRNFTRVEEFAFTERGTRRNVIQQNPSGNITTYEEVLDREDGGTFRRTQRFRDESGEATTQISTNYSVTDPFILTNGGAYSEPIETSPFTQLRGTQLDLSA